MKKRYFFDFSAVSNRIFREISKHLYRKEIHRKTSELAKKIVKLTKLEKLTGLQFEDAIDLVEDIIEIQMRNLEYREKLKSKEISGEKKALFLPHCSRKFMDNRCKAIFDEKRKCYVCQTCSNNCLINKASKLGKAYGFDVFVVPGGSCVEEIVKKEGYKVVVGVACPAEAKLGFYRLKDYCRVLQAVLLTKNGCAGTKFNLNSLKEVLKSSYLADI